MRSVKSFLLLLICSAVFVVAVAVLIKGAHSYVSSSGNKKYATEFADMQSKHKSAAVKYGFKAAPLTERGEVRNVQGLERVRSCRFYKVNEMRHGLPYLTPSAKEELRSLSMDFQDGCRSKSITPARLIITSMLRTEDDVRGLREENQNAVEDSAHQYGTTFDITWAHFQSYNKKVDGQEYLSLLSDVLRKHRDEGRIYVRYEVRQECFHITVNR